MCSDRSRRHLTCSEVRVFPALRFELVRRRGCGPTIAGSCRCHGFEQLWRRRDAGKDNGIQPQWQDDRLRLKHCQSVLYIRFVGNYSAAISLS